MKDSAGVEPITRARQVEIFRDLTLRTREREAKKLPPHIKDIRHDGSRDALMLVDFICSLDISKQNILRDRLLADHGDYVHSAAWNKLGDQLILILRSSTRHDPNLRRRARGDLPQILSEFFNSLQ